MLFFLNFHGSTEVTEYLTRDSAQCQGDLPGVTRMPTQFYSCWLEKSYSIRPFSLSVRLHLSHVLNVLSLVLFFCEVRADDPKFQNQFYQARWTKYFFQWRPNHRTHLFWFDKRNKDHFNNNEAEGKCECALDRQRRWRETRKRYSARLDFFDLKGVILQEDRGMLLLVLFGRSDTWQTNSHCLCPFLIATRGTKLQLGTHVYPFTCQLPLGCVWPFNCETPTNVWSVLLREACWQKSLPPSWFLI